MKESMADPLAEFNRLYKKMDEIYHQYAKRKRVSDMILWMLYSLNESDAAYTQREFCSAWHYPPQTVNSALKTLEKQGAIVLESVPGNQKNKRIVLTEKGKVLTGTVIAPLVLAEQNAFQGMEAAERDALLHLTRKYTDLLQEEAGRL